MLVFSGINSVYSQNSDQEVSDNELENLLQQSLESTGKMDYDIAIEKAAQLVAKASQINQNDYIFYGYNLLSINHIQIQDSIPSLQYARRALEYAQRAENDTLLAWGYNNLAAGLAPRIETRMEALDYYKKSLTISRRLNTGKFLDPALNIAELYRDQNRFDQMPAYLSEAENSLDPEEVYYDDPRIYLDILWGDYYRGVDQPAQSAVFYERAYNRIEEDKIRFLAIDLYDRYSNFLAENGEYSKAYLVQQKYQKYYAETERINDQETVQLAKAHAESQELKRQRNEAELKQQLADQNLERKKMQSLLLGSILGMLLIFVGYLFVSTRLRQNLMADLQKNNKELNAAKIMAENSVKAKTKFFSTISHEMRTPLYGVTGIVSLLEQSSQIKGHKDDLRSLKFSANHLLDIINDLLDISKLDNRGFKLEKRPFNIKLLIDEIISSFDQYNLENTNKIHFIHDSATPNYIIGDSRRISQVLLNILSNAMKFTQNGDIWLRLNSKSVGDGEYCLNFEIQDNGIGITHEAQKSIFDEFSQIENLNQGSQRGSGLGLPIVKKLLDKMHSDIFLKSELGVGSTFSFNINFKEATLLDVMEFGSGIDERNTAHYNLLLSNASILIVDDNKINRLVTKKVLDKKNVITSEAASGEEAIKKVKKGNYDLILMDINMPGLNGFETTRIIREMDTQIPIIALTASDAVYMEKEIKNSGMNGAIIKPYSMEEFLNVIIVHLSTYRKSASI